MRVSFGPGGSEMCLCFVFEPGARREAVRRRVEVAAFVEGRVGGDQVDCAGVDAAEEGEVVAVVEGAVGEVRRGHIQTPAHMCAR